MVQPSISNISHKIILLLVWLRQSAFAAARAFFRSAAAWNAWHVNETPGRQYNRHAADNPVWGMGKRWVVQSSRIPASLCPEDAAGDRGLNNQKSGWPRSRF
jgi:hypothetical protein